MLPASPLDFSVVIISGSVCLYKHSTDSLLFLRPSLLSPGVLLA